MTVPSFAETGLAVGTSVCYRVTAVNGSSVSAASETVGIVIERPLVIPCFAAGADGGGAVRCGEGTVHLRWSGARDPRLERVCSDSLGVPVEQWAAVSNSAFSDADPVTGAVTVSIVTNRPQMFFAVRVK